MTSANDKILDWSKLKAFADNKMNLPEKLKPGLGQVENIVGKGQSAGYQHFLLFLQCFQKPSLSGTLKVGIVWKRVKVSLSYFVACKFFQFEQFLDFVDR